MPVDLATVGLDALRISQRALSTTSHNIANAATPGYSRQRVELATREPLFEGGVYLGRGVTVTDVRRIFDEVTNDQIELQRSNQSQAEEFASLALRLDRLMSDPVTGLSQPLQQFFAELEGFSSNPGDAVQGQLLLDGGNALARKFNDLHTALGDMSRESNAHVADLVNEVNYLSDAVAKLNGRIQQSPSGVPANDLLDQRDELLRGLAELVGITTVRQDGDSGPVNVYLDSGHALVVGTTTASLGTSVDPFNAGRVEVTNEAGALLSPFIGGGRLGGLLSARSELLDPAINELGRIAVGLTSAFNAQHALGMDQLGNMGQDFFTGLAAGVASSTSNTGTGSVTAVVSAIGDLTTSNYTLTFDGGTAYTLQRDADGATFAIDTGGAAAYTAGPFDGFTLEITAGAAAGDRFRILPTANAARDFAVELTSTRLIAAGLPVRAEVDVGNLGDVTLSIGAVPSAANLPLTGPPIAGDLVLTFDAATNTFTRSSDPLAEGPLAFDPVLDANGRSYTLLGGDLEITIAGTPLDGDQIAIKHNVGATGDNGNVTRLLALQQANLLNGNSATLSQTLAARISSIGTQARDATRSEATFAAMLDQAESARDQLAGVNMDEEAANLLRFQQAYQAAAEIIRVSDDIFQTLLGVVRN